MNAHFKNNVDNISYNNYDSSWEVFQVPVEYDWANMVPSSSVYSASQCGWPSRMLNYLYARTSYLVNIHSIAHTLTVSGEAKLIFCRLYYTPSLQWLGLKIVTAPLPYNYVYVSFTAIACLQVDFFPGDLNYHDLLLWTLKPWHCLFDS